MKISVRQNCGYVDLETETTRDIYLIGRIALKVGDVYVRELNDGSHKMRVELLLDKVIEELAK